MASRDMAHARLCLAWAGEFEVNDIGEDEGIWRKDAALDGPSLGRLARRRCRNILARIYAYPPSEEAGYSITLTG